MHVKPIDLGNYDVLVCGGGPGGIGAAVASSRAGAKTLLVERFGCFGGTWTSGILSAIMPFPFVRGIFLEIIDRLKKAQGWRAFEHLEPGTPPSELGKDSSGGAYDSEVLKVVLDSLILESGIDPLFFAQLADVEVKNGTFVSASFLTKEGPLRVNAKVFVDASGDGDLCTLAGAGFQLGRDIDGACQPMTMIFKMDGVDDSKALPFRRQHGQLEDLWMLAKQRSEVTIAREDVLWNPMPKPGQWNFNTTRILGYDGTNARDVTKAMIEGRKQVMEVAAFMKRYVPGFENAFVSETPAHVGVRETRHVFCDYMLTLDDITRPATFPDAVARGNWFVDIHNPEGEGTVRMHPPAGTFYEIPYRSLCPAGLNNALIASRCLGATHEAHAAVRITPQIVAIGQAAGTAAALFCQQNAPDIRDIDRDLLQSRLRQAGAFV
jgi:hypothetical protein